MISETDCFTLAAIVLFEVLVAITACFDTGMMKMERQSSDSNSYWQTVERTWSIFNDGRSRIYFLRDNLGRRGGNGHG